MLKSGLQVWCYTAPSQSYYPQAQIDYSQVVDSLRFTTLQPGGFGQLTCKIPVGNATIPRSEFALFSRIVVFAPSGYRNVTGNPVAVFIGEMTQPELTSDANGEYFNIQALGIGNCLRDDPRNVTYQAMTAQQIITNEMTVNNRSHWMPISSDQSAVFPDNPATLLYPSYMGYALEDIINDVALLAGDYAWGVWSHPYGVDLAGFPLGELQIHLRDSSTVDYQAILGKSDIVSWRITPSADRAYNSMLLLYNDPTAANQYNNVVQNDSRLTGTLTQGTAPFRYRRYFQDFTGTTTVTAAQAAAIASTQLGIMKNPTNKIEMVLRRVRDPGNQELPLWSVQADNNISVPELAQRGQALALFATGGINLFYILSTEYSEDSSGGQQLTLQCDNWYDYSQTRLARLEMRAYKQAMNGTTAAPVQALGSPDAGVVGMQTNGVGSQTYGIYYNYHVALANTPTSITLSGGVTTNAGSVAVSSITQVAFFFSWVASAGGNTEAVRNYVTVGNCLLDVDLEHGTFDHHCEICNQTRTGLSILEHIRIETPHADPEKRHLPGNYALMVDCPCGASEAFNTGLTEEHEQETPGNAGHHAQQSKMIRRLQKHDGLQKALMVKAGKA